ncbi:MAG: hypothetical protein AAF497_14005 [Planctomycetota bacterium]
MPDWFTKLMGFAEGSPEEVRRQIELQGNTITSKANGETYRCGRLEIVALKELRERVHKLESNAGRLQVSEVVDNVQNLHIDPTNAGATFQVASQFNLLEMVAPSVTPEHGITGYEHDLTQGPACAIACGAGTIYRNYFVPLDGQIGQSADKQVDCIRSLADALDVPGQPWEMRNGYAIPSKHSLNVIAEKLASLSDSELDHLRGKVEIGIQWDTQVTIGQSQHDVTQVYCSAMPVAYTRLASKLWEPLARLILDAAYEATLSAAELNRENTGNRRLFLTLLGGGAFGNDTVWICDAIQRACRLFQDSDLDVRIVSFGRSKSEVVRLIRDLEL